MIIGNTYEKSKDQFWSQVKVVCTLVWMPKLKLEHWIDSNICRFSVYSVNGKRTFIFIVQNFQSAQYFRTHHYISQRKRVSWQQIVFWIWFTLTMVILFYGIVVLFLAYFWSQFSGPWFQHPKGFRTTIAECLTSGFTRLHRKIT